MVFVVLVIIFKTLGENTSYELTECENLVLEDSMFEENYSDSDWTSESDNYIYDPYEGISKTNLKDSLNLLADLYKNEEFLTMQRNLESFYLNRNIGCNGTHTVILLNDPILDKIVSGENNLSEVISSINTSSSVSTNFTDIVNQINDGANIQVHSPNYPQTQSQIMQAEIDALDKFFSRQLEIGRNTSEALSMSFENRVRIRPVIISTVPVSEPQPLPSWTNISADHPDYVVRERWLNKMIEEELYKVEDSTNWMETEDNFNLDTLFQSDEIKNNTSWMETENSFNLDSIFESKDK